MALGKVNRKELTLISDVLPMQYDLVIKRTLREAQGMLWANLPPASNLPDAQAVKSLNSRQALARTPQVHQALKRGNDTALCFALRAVNRILSDEGQPNTTINRLRDVLDEPELNRALGQNSRMILGQKKPPAR